MLLKAEKNRIFLCDRKWLCWDLYVWSKSVINLFKIAKGGKGGFPMHLFSVET